MANGKLGIIAIGGALIGFLLGSWTGRGSTRDLEAQIEKLQTDLAAEKKRAQASAPFAMGLQSLLQDRPAAAKSAGPGPSPAPLSGGKAAQRDAEEDDEDEAPRFAETAANSAERKEVLDTAAATWKLRATQSRAAFVEQAKLTAEQQTALQTAVDHLNEGMKTVASQLMERIDLSKPPQRRDVVDAGVAIGEVYQDIDDELRHFLSDEQMTQLNESEFDVMSQVDPQIFMPFLLKLEPPK